MMAIRRFMIPEVLFCRLSGFKSPRKPVRKGFDYEISPNNKKSLLLYHNVDIRGKFLKNESPNSAGFKYKEGDPAEGGINQNL
jgi:hypothetical protein